MAEHKVRKPIQGQPFNEVLSELHAHAFAGVPGESDPFTLSELERELIAYALAIYYQCEHCQQYHGHAIDRLRQQLAARPWDWRSDLIRIVLFLRIRRLDVSAVEWSGWVDAWRRFAQRIHYRQPVIACNIAYAIGIARADEYLMDLAFESLSTHYQDDHTLLGVIRDIDRVVVFMKAATSKNRTDPILQRQLKGRGIDL